MQNKTRLTIAAAFTFMLGAAPLAHAETTGQYVDDATITTKVKAALLSDSKLKALHVSVATDQGTVQLGGSVDSKSEESEAIKVANDVDGVKVVKDVMTVRGSQEP